MIASSTRVENFSFPWYAPWYVMGQFFQCTCMQSNKPSIPGIPWTTMKHVLHPLPYMCAGNMHKGPCEQCTNKTSQQQAVQLIHPSGNSLSMHSLNIHIPNVSMTIEFFAPLQMLGHPHMSYSSTLKNECSCRMFSVNCRHFMIFEISIKTMYC